MEKTKTKSKMTILVENLTKKFKQHTAVNGVSFEVNEGETFALLGPNGSGKTTTLKCLVGLTLPSSGRIAVDGFDLLRNSREAKRLMSFLPQRVSFSDQLTGREVMEFYCRLRRIPRERIDETLNTPDFHFNGFFERPVSHFSGGMIQRLGLAVACLPDAPVLVLDEPTVSLDPSGAIQFREFLGELKSKGKTIVFSSHMLADVEQLADRVAILVGGRLVAVQSISALREQLMESSRMRVMLPNPSASLLEAVQGLGVDDVVIDGNSLLITSHAEDRLAILRAIETAGGRIASFATEELSLEDIYMKYVNREKAEIK
jgi:ABC-type multidrug transport system ATPase subunit